MATKKPIAKSPAKKPAPAKAKPAVKKAAPVKVVAKKAAPKAPAKKAAPAKVVAKKVAPKAVAKPAPKKAVAKKPAPAPAKAVAKKPAPTKVASKKVETKKNIAAPKAAPAKVAPKKAAPAPQKPVAKKAEIKKPVAAPKPAPQKVEAAKPAAAPAKKAEPAKPTPAAKPAGPTIKAMAKNPKDIKIPAPKPVVIPKITTKTSRAYQPDFTKSVLDQQKNDPGAPMLRYSDNDLQEFKDLIQRKLESAKKELNYLQGLITRKDDTGGDESENRYMTMEDGSLSMERENLSQMASRQITFIDHLEKALMRIESKTYGVCRVTGKLIDKARLRAVPHATLSIEAKMGMVK